MNKNNLKGMCKILSSGASDTFIITFMKKVMVVVQGIENFVLVVRKIQRVGDTAAIDKESYSDIYIMLRTDFKILVSCGD